MTTVSVIDVESKPVVQDKGLKFTIDTTGFRNAVASASRAIAARPTHAVLANVKITALNDAVKIEATDLSLVVELTVPAKVDREGSTTIAGKLLSDILSKLPAGDVALDHADARVTVRQGKSKFQLGTIDADAFPEMLKVDGNTFSIDQAVIDCIKSVVYATSADETKQILTGVHLNFLKDKIEAAATNGHRLSVASTSCDFGKDFEEFALTIPAKAVRELLRLVSEGDSLNVIANCSQILCQWNGSQLGSRLLEGRFPAFRQLIPRTFTRIATIDVKILQGVLDRVGVIAKQKNRIVALTLDPNQQMLRCSVDAGDAGAVDDEMPIQYIDSTPPAVDSDGNSVEVKNSPFTIAFDLRYLKDAVKQPGTPEIELKMNSAMSPIVISGETAHESLALVMPVQLRSL